jgi:hypothetical protein
MEDGRHIDEVLQFHGLSQYCEVFRGIYILFHSQHYFFVIQCQFLYSIVVLSRGLQIQLTTTCTNYTVNRASDSTTT